MPSTMELPKQLLTSDINCSVLLFCFQKLPLNVPMPVLNIDTVFQLKSHSSLLISSFYISLLLDFQLI